MCVHVLSHPLLAYFAPLTLFVAQVAFKNGAVDPVREEYVGTWSLAKNRRVSQHACGCMCCECDCDVLQHTAMQCDAPQGNATQITFYAMSCYARRDTANSGSKNPHKQYSFGWDFLLPWGNSSLQIRIGFGRTPKF